MVIKAPSSELKVNKNIWCSIKLYLKKPSLNTILVGGYYLLLFCWYKG